VTGFYRTETNTNSQSFVYQGYARPPGKALEGRKRSEEKGDGVFHNLNYPPQPNLTPTATELYSLDLISKRKIHAVGSFSAEEFTGVQGCLYTGPLTGLGKSWPSGQQSELSSRSESPVKAEGDWKPLVPQGLTVLPILNTIAHSVMGDVVVGNYKTDERFSNAFIYDIKTDQYFPLVTSEFPIVSISAYGVWHNGNEGYSRPSGQRSKRSGEDHSRPSGQRSEEEYVIVGGLARSGLNPDIIEGFMVNWNNKTRRLSKWRLFTAPDSAATHFEGISRSNSFSDDCANSYTLAAQSALNPYFVRASDHDSTWKVLNYPGSSTTTSDSVAGDIVIGSFILEDASQLQGYVSVPRHRR